VRELIEAAGARLRYLPKYSPDLNPIEQAFSKLKAQHLSSWGEKFLCLHSGRTFQSGRSVSTLS
jgi:transposase